MDLRFSAVRQYVPALTAIFLAFYFLNVMGVFALERDWATDAKAILYPGSVRSIGILLGAILILTFGVILSTSERAAIPWWSAFVLPPVIGWFALRGFENSADEYAYVFQAKTFASGVLSVPDPPLVYVFSPELLVDRANKLVSQYPPGWAAVLAIPAALDLPLWLVNPCIAALSVWLFRRISGSDLGAAVYAFSLFFVFNAASYFSHLFFATVIMGFVYTLSRNPMLAGVLLSIAGVTRPFPAFLIGVAFVLHHLLNRRPIKPFLLVVVGAIPATAAHLIYNATVFGHPLMMGYYWEPSNITKLQIPGTQTTVKTIKRLLELMVWTSPILAPIYAGAAFLKVRARQFGFADWLFPAVVLGYLAFLSMGGNRYGPRYYFDVYPFFLLTILSATPLLNKVWQSYLKRSLVLSITYSLVALPFFALFFHTVVSERLDLHRQTAGLRNAIVVIEASTGGILPMAPHDLARNADMTAPVIYAQNTSVAEMQRVFPERAVWAYRRHKAEKTGRIVKLAAPNPD